MRIVFLVLLCVSAFVVGPATSSAAEQDAPAISGIATLSVGIDSVRITKDPALPPGMALRAGAKATSVTELSVGIGESFSISDGHHVGTTYKLLGIADGIASIEAVTWTHFPGDAETRDVRTMRLRSYDLVAPGE